LKMNSGWLLKISKYCIAVVGIVSNNENYYKRIEKAGKNRNLGWRPKVRGVAMNPCDHPHGGGEGTGSPPRAHKSLWGKLAKVPTKRTKKYLLKKKLFKSFLK
jgi:large subunit ribosomal protein L2